MDDLDSSRTNRLLRKQIMNERKATPKKRDTPGASSSRAQCHNASSSTADACGLDDSRINLNQPTHSCQHCGAIFWFAERLKSIRGHVPIFALYCRQGRVSLPESRDPPQLLKQLLDYNGGETSKLFREKIRSYNSMFAFTSIGAKVDKDINRGRGPYVFKLNGINHHLIGSLLPIHGEKPHFAQLYIYDTENEASNRLAALSGSGADEYIDQNIVFQLIEMFDEVNQLAKAFRMARDRFASGETRQVSLVIPAKRSNDGLQYSAPLISEMAALIVGDIGITEHGRDIVIQHQTTGLQRISDLHPAFMAMQYPILFPYGEDGFRLDIPYRIDPNKVGIKRGHVTRREFYCYMLQQRNGSENLLIKGGRLFQQYVVDAFTSVEDERLRYIRYKHQQDHYRCEIYSGVQDAFLRGDVAAKTIGKRVILPSSFTGSPRYMIKHYHDAMTICRSRGNPDLFITFTCNVQWIEIRNALAIIHGQKIEDRPDIISRVFHMKLDAFMADIKNGKYFGQVVGAIHTVEFQKRGLPHVHIIIWLDEKDKFPQPSDIDRIICAEIPDRVTEPDLYRIVSKFMIHGPCGIANPKAPCMSNGRCTKHFPRKNYAQTEIGEDGFAIYRRRDDGKFVVKLGVELDNRFVVPYNKRLLLKYEAHVNVEWCNRSRAITYLFKYVNKGPDRTRAFLQEDTQSTTDDSVAKPEVVDEVKNYVDCRYVAPYESTWRIFEYHIHFKFPAVESLSIHMPLMNNVLFRGDVDVDAIFHQPGIEKTMLTEWMFTNTLFEDARQLTYTEFPSFWRWDGPNKIWFRRKRGQCIGRISYVHPSAGDLYYLRLLLSHAKGPMNFIDIRTVNGEVYETFKQACNAMGLIGDDREWHEAMEEASMWATASQLRELFVTMVLFCEVVDVNNLFEASVTRMQEDVIYRLRNMLGISNLQISSDEVKNNVLLQLESLLKKTAHH